MLCALAANDEMEVVDKIMAAGQSLKVGLDLIDVPVPPFQIQQVGDEFVIKTLPDYPARVAGGYCIRRKEVRPSPVRWRCPSHRP